MSTSAELLDTFPNAQVVVERYELDEQAFIAQKLKHESGKAEGGSIGIVWQDNNHVVLTRRIKLHPGWALLGGTVEYGQSFEDAF